MTHDGAAHGHALTLAAGELLGLAIEVLLEVEDARRLLDLLRALVLGHLLLLQREADVLGHGHVRIERVALEDHGHVAVLGLDQRDVAVADADGALVTGFQPGEHAQGGRLAGAGRADEHEELPVVDDEVEAIDGGSFGARVDPGRVSITDFSHDFPT